MKVQNIADYSSYNCIQYLYCYIMRELALTPKEIENLRKIGFRTSIYEEAFYDNAGGHQQISDIRTI